MNYPTELNQLKNRFEVFIQKLKVKATELYQEAEPVAQLMYDEDDDRYKRSYRKFQSGIEGQFLSIIDKAQNVFNSQITPMREEDRFDFSIITKWYSEMNDLIENFEKEIYDMKDYIFDNVKEISPETDLQAILEEYEEVKDAFHCEQCGGNLEIDQMYFVSTYITCPYCQSQNTFVPGSRMKELQHLSRDVAAERLKPLKQEQENILQNDNSRETKKLLYNYYRAMIWLEKSKIVPVFQDEYAKVYFRELHETVSQYDHEPLKENPNFYETLLKQFGFVKEMKPKVLKAYEDNDLTLVRQLLKDWQMLYALSAYTVPKLYQGKTLEHIYSPQFERVQKEWTALSQLNKSIENQDLSLEEVMNEVKNKF